MKRMRPSVFIFIFAIIIFAAGWFTTIKSKRQEIAKKQEVYQNLQNQLRKTTAVVKRKKEANRRLQIISKKWAQAQKMLPKEASIPQLLRTLTKLSGSCDVKIQHLKPSPQREKEKYTEIPIEVKIAGGYHNIGRFMAGLNNMSRIVKVQGLKLSEGKELEEGEFVISAAFALITYISKGGKVEG